MNRAQIYDCILVNLSLKNIISNECIRLQLIGNIKIGSSDEMKQSSFFLTLSLSSLDSDLFVVFLKGGQIFSGFGELSLLHTLTDVPMDEGSLGVHQIELVVESAEHLGNGSGVGDHAASSHDLGEITSGHDCGRLIVDADLETSGAPVDELDGSLGLDGGNSSIDILGHDVSSVHHGASHVLSVSRVALGHHVGGLEAAVGDFSNGELFVVGLLSRDDGRVRRQHEVDSGVGDQVGLELSDIYVEGTIEPQRSSEGGDDLRDESVQVGVGGSLNIEVSSADIVDGLVVEHDSDVSVLEEGVGGEDGVVGLDDGSGDLGRGVDGEAELGLLSVVDGESLEEERSETGSSSTTDGVEHEEALETSAVVSQLSDSVEAEIDDFLSDGVMSSGEVIGGILLSGDELLGVEELSVGSGSDLINDGGLEIEEDASRNVLSSSGLGEESVEGIITASNSLVGGHLAVRLDSVLETEEFPASVSDLNTSLTNVDGDYLSHVNQIISYQINSNTYRVQEVQLRLGDVFIIKINNKIRGALISLEGGGQGIGDMRTCCKSVSMNGKELEKSPYVFG